MTNVVEASKNKSYSQQLYFNMTDRNPKQEKVHGTYLTNMFCKQFVYLPYHFSKCSVRADMYVFYFFVQILYTPFQNETLAVDRVAIRFARRDAFLSHSRLPIIFILKRFVRDA